MRVSEVPESVTSTGMFARPRKASSPCVTVTSPAMRTWLPETSGEKMTFLPMRTSRSAVELPPSTTSKPLSNTVICPNLKPSASAKSRLVGKVRAGSLSPVTTKRESIWTPRAVKLIPPASTTRRLTFLGRLSQTTELTASKPFVRTRFLPI